METAEPADSFVTPSEGLVRTLDEHALWVGNEDQDGRRAGLAATRLTGRDPCGRLLHRIELAGADLRRSLCNCHVSHRHDMKRRPEVRCADLTDAIFKGANIMGAQCLGANLSEVRGLVPEQLQSGCGVDARMPAGLSEFLPDCGEAANRGIATEALNADSEIDAEENPRWHEMRSDFHPGPATES